MSEDRDQLRHALLGRLSGRGGPAAWAQLLDAGVLGLRVPEPLGGLGLTADEVEPVFDVLGQLCLATPYLETAVIAAGLLGRLRGEVADAVLTRIAQGARVAVAGVEPGLTVGVSAMASGEAWRLTGRLSVVLGGLDAEALLVLIDLAGEPALFLVDQADLGTRRAVPTIDGRMAADITLDQARAVRLSGEVAGALGAVRDEAAAAVCIEAAALCRRLVTETRDYAKQRQQFGQALSGFQVVRHRLVDMNIQARRLTAIAHRAIAALKADPVERARIVSAAKVTAARVGRLVGQNAVQLHGGMGMTEELAIGRMFKRLTVIESELGSADFHLDRYRRAHAAA